jgi:hypothetical protein
MPKLPEGLARSGAPTAVAAMRDGMGDPMRLDEKRRHAGSKSMCLGLLGRKWM